MQELRTLEGLYPYPINNTKKTLLIDPSQTPEMIRGFVNYKDQKEHMPSLLVIREAFIIHMTYLMGAY